MIDESLLVQVTLSSFTVINRDLVNVRKVEQGSPKSKMSRRYRCKISHVSTYCCEGSGVNDSFDSVNDSSDSVANSE